MGDWVSDSFGLHRAWAREVIDQLPLFTIQEQGFYPLRALEIKVLPPFDAGRGATNIPAPRQAIYTAYDFYHPCSVASM